MADTMEMYLIIHEIMDETDVIAMGDEHDDDILPALAAAGVLKREEVPRVATFEETVDRYTDWDFKRNFRLTRLTFESLLGRLELQLEPEMMRGKEPISPRKQLMIFIWYISNQDTIREISNLFGVSSSTVHDILKKVSRAVVSLKGNLIKWPDAENQQAISHAFAEQSGIENCVGCIDGTHIRLATALGGDNDYYNRKGFPSIQLQLVVDDRMLIRDAYVGWPGCTHDARVFRNSPLAGRLDDGHLFEADKFIIGDAAYPNSRCLVTPFKNFGRMTEEQRFYNRKVSGCRQVVERAIGILKGRFRRLRDINCHDAEDICHYILAACVLHNLCIFCDDDIDDMFYEDENNHPNNYPPIFVNHNEGRLRRDALVAQLWQHR